LRLFFKKIKLGWIYRYDMKGVDRKYDFLLGIAMVTSEQL
jgi:hypothetical protein